MLVGYAMVHPTEDENTFICQQGAVFTWHSLLYLLLREEIHMCSEVIFPSQHCQPCSKSALSLENDGQDEGGILD